MGPCMINGCDSRAVGWAKQGERNYHLCNKHLLRSRRRPGNWACIDCGETPMPGKKKCRRCYTTITMPNGTKWNPEDCLSEEEIRATRHLRDEDSWV